MVILCSLQYNTTIEGELRNIMKMSSKERRKAKVVFENGERRKEKWKHW